MTFFYLDQLMLLYINSSQAKQILFSALSQRASFCDSTRAAIYREIRVHRLLSIA